MPTYPVKLQAAQIGRPNLVLLSVKLPRSVRFIHRKREVQMQKVQEKKWMKVDEHGCRAA